MQGTPPTPNRSTAGGSAPGAARTRWLSHHELLSLSAPFIRRGLQPCPEAVDRAARRIRFLPRHEPAAGITVEFVLDASGRRGPWRLVRTATRDDGLVARVHANGTDPGRLLNGVEAIDPASQFQQGAGYVLAVDRRVAATSDAGHERGASALRALARIGEATLVATFPRVRGLPARLSLRWEDSAPDTLPEDLFAVLGADWSFLRTDTAGWRGDVRLRGRGAERGEDGVRRAHVAAAHLARTLSEPPCRFHERLRSARWRAAARRALPIGVLGAMGAEAAFAAELLALPWPALRLALIGTPPATLLLFMCRSHEPWLAWPHAPRPIVRARWHASR